MKNPIPNRAMKSLFFAIVGGASALGATTAFAVEDIVESARVSCQKDIETYCKDVTRGEGRILQCLSPIKTRFPEDAATRWTTPRFSWNEWPSRSNTWPPNARTT